MSNNATDGALYFNQNAIPAIVLELWRHFEAFEGASVHGRAIVLMDIDDKKYGEILLPPSLTDTPHKRLKSERLLRATVIDAKMPGYPEIVCGARVLVKPWAGLHISSTDDVELECAKFIPEGRQVRFYKEAPHDSIVALIEEE
jgi:hypothetical protein